jgi:hypothetical protein
MVGCGHLRRRRAYLHSCSKIPLIVMKRWIDTWRVEPPDHTVMGRYGASGASVMDVAYSHVTNSWYHVWGGHQKEIAEPQMLFLDEDYARKHARPNPVPPENSQGMRKKKQEQLMLL